MKQDESDGDQEFSTIIGLGTSVKSLKYKHKIILKQERSVQGLYKPYIKI
jgi:hypothetical protein